MLPVALPFLLAGCSASQSELQGIRTQSAMCDYGVPTEFAEAARGEHRAILKELLERVDAEQRCMLIMGEADPSARKGLWTKLGPFIEATLRQNANWLKSKLKRYPLHSIKYAGVEGSKAAWLIVQHADHDVVWQENVKRDLLPLVEAKDFDGASYAMLVDRVSVNQGLLQTYGSQGKCQDDGVWHPKPIADPESVNERRKAVGLNTFEENIARFKC